MPDQAEWYTDGLAFDCTMCGNCCTGPAGYVWFNEKEGAEMARTLGLSEADFRRRFARKVGDRWSLAERRTPHGLDCVFLDRETMPGKALCRVYQARPTQCRTWPFWPENLHTPDSWERAGRNCPGINQGPLIPIEEIRITRDETPGD